MKYKIQKAKVEDVPHIYKLVNKFAKKNLMLPRVLNEIYEKILEFFVIKYKNKLIGCAALHITWTGKDQEVLAEIRSLAIEENYQNKGLGSSLVTKIEKEAKKLGVEKIFALTFTPEFFKKLKYEVVSRDTLPHKIWTECINCPFFMECKEVPVVKQLK
ncbi:MAG: N-acetyltransferase [Elusimicrobiota bacterium]|nr:N-acetyltransferase [Endomicrobiia bacterium]MDW8165625.1 N-acetyltransferase [Elusimicrobiota bacterium]